MIKTRFYHIGRAAMLAAFLLLIPMASHAANTVADSSVSGEAVPKKNINKKVKKKSSFANPDFAFPETVAGDARQELDKALASGDDLKAMAAAMQLIVARNMVSGSSFNENVAMLDSMSGKLSEPYSSLCSLLQAGLYNSLFKADRWQYMQRVLPLDTYPEDPKSWCGQLFAKKILELTTRATSRREAAEKMPIAEISPILDNWEEASRSGLSVWDFIVYNSTTVLQNYSDGNAEVVIPFRSDAGQKPQTEGEKCVQMMKTLLEGLVDYNRTSGNIPALAVAVCRYSEILPASQRAGYLRKESLDMMKSPEGGRVLNEWFQTSGESNPESEEGGGDATGNRKEIYGAMKEWLSTNPSSRFAGIVRHDMGRMEQRSLNISLPDEVLPGDSVKGVMNLGNMTAGYVLVYKVPSSMLPKGGLNHTSFMSKSRLVASVRVDAEGETPFMAKKEFRLPPMEAGNYVAIPSATPKLSKRWRKEVSQWSVRNICVSSLSLITSGFRSDKKATRLYVVDGRTQKPVEGVTVRFYKDNESGLLSTGVTNAEGFCPLPEGGRLVYVSKGSDAKWDRVYFVAGAPREVRVRAFANILTDLSIYRPGDKVGFSLTGWTQKGHENTLLKNSRVRIILRDANHKDVDTLTLTTDGYGRCNGSFTLPENGLQGRFMLYSEFEGYKDSTIGMTGFQVQDYKAPGFFVSLKSDSGSSYTVGDVVKFPGRALTWSGMPLAGCEVTYKVEWQPWWRWYDGGGSASYGGNATTDDNGQFSIELPTANLKGTRYERGIFTIEASVTSLSGETQNAPVFRFSLGDGLTVNPSIPQIMEASSDTLRFNVPVYDMLGHPVVKKVDYTITDSTTGKETAAGSFDSPTLELPASVLPSARYKLAFNLPGDTVRSDAEVAVYRKTDVRPPYATPLWIPEERIICKEGTGEVNVKAGSGFPGSWLLCEISDERGFVERKWIQADDANVAVAVKAPDAKSRKWVSFSGMHDLDRKVCSVEIIPASQTRKMKVKASSFRDRITAGDRERWTFSFTVDGKPQPGIPAMAVMSNKALNAIEPFTWNFEADRGFWINSASLSGNTPGMFTTSAKFGPSLRYPDMTGSSIPWWNTYGYGLGTVSRMYATRSMKQAMLTGSVNIAYEQVKNEAMLDEAYSPMLAESKVTASADTMARGTSDYEEEAEAALPEPGEGGARGNEVKERPRPVEMPLAFFMPSLTADTLGNVSVDFVTPNFNTTWQFQIAGYTDELLTAGLTADAVASKPVMVQSNLPRYLRSGDKAFISALLFNNSETTLPLHGVIEVLDPLSDKIIVKFCSEAMATESSASRMVSVEFDVPSDMSRLVVRAYAFGGDYSDGEQDLVPVLPSSTPVVESAQFYLPAEESVFSMKLPKYRKDANLTLKYCDNPIWECILALPSISKPDSKNINVLMRALYANSVALDVAGKYPTVREGLSKALAASEAGDTTVLRSNLQKDAALKTVALGDTPWVNNAEAETKRMESLSSLLDETTAKTATDKILDDVLSLQNADGGWSWCPGMKSSTFMTQQVLLHFGMMSRIGCMPKDAKVAQAINKGIDYCDKELYKDYVKSDRKYSTVSMLGYLYVRSFFKAGNGPKGFSALKAKALKSISEEWRSFSIYDKATAATLLSRSAGYGRIPGEILESLRQLAVRSETKGWSYDNLSSGIGGWSKLITTAQALEAFAEIEPEAEAVDGLRQWLVLQKETEDWGRNPYTVEVIQSILSCGTDWTSAGEIPEIRLDGKTVKLPESGLLTGMLTVDLDRKSASGKTLTILRKGEGPAWGGVISQYVAPIKDVKAERCENLSIEKRIYVVSDTEAGEVAEEKPVKVGDKIRVTLTVTCDKDMDYVALIDERAACLEPDSQRSEYTVTDGLGAYREVRDSKTSFFIGFLPKGVNVISYDCHADREGEYALGIASVQSQYSPAQVAHSAGKIISVKKR